MSEKIKIIHAADLHLDSPSEGLGDKAAQRRREQRELMRRIAALAEEKKADMLLLAGDLLDSDGTYAETAQILCEVFRSLACPVFIAPGNHDYYSASSPYAKLDLPENVHIFKSNRMECVALPELNARVWGVGFEDSACPGLLKGFEAVKDGDTVDICVLHGEVGAAMSKYSPITEDEIARSGMDYIALGHVHSFSGLKRAGETFYAYPGCPEGRGFDECGEKGVLYIELTAGKCEAEFVPVSRRRYEILSAEADRINEMLPKGTENDVYRLILTGECDESPNIPVLYEQLKDRFFSLQIIDRTTLRRDIWEKSEQDTLRGLFLRKMRTMLDSAKTDAERQKITQATRWGLAALDGGEAVADI